MNRNHLFRNTLLLLRHYTRVFFLGFQQILNSHFPYGLGATLGKQASFFFFFFFFCLFLQGKFHFIFFILVA